ncbi:MAG: response regulator [Thermovirgaceae bacterium]
MAETFSKDREDWAESDLKRALAARQAIKTHLQLKLDFLEFQLIDADTGVVELCTEPTREGANRLQEDYFQKSLESGSIYTGGIRRLEYLDGRPAMVLAVPVFAEKETEPFAVLAGLINLESFLYPFLCERARLGETGETFLVGPDGLALSPLRWEENAPLRRHVSIDPARFDSQGGKGLIETGDYRGTEVIAAYSLIPDLEWAMVVKQDVAEIYGPVNRLVRDALLIGAACILIALLIALAAARNISRPLARMSEAATQIRNGRLDERIALDRKDELGELASTLNGLADNLVSRIAVREKSAHIMTALLPLRTVEDFARKATERLMETFDASMGAFHLLDADTGRFVHMYSAGFDPVSVNDTDTGSLGGLVGRVLAGGDLLVFDRSSVEEGEVDEELFAFSTPFGTTEARQVVAIPVANEEETLGMITLASMNVFTEEQLEVIRQDLPGIVATLERVLATRRMLEMTSELREKNLELQAQSEQLKQQAEELHEQNLELDVQKMQVEEANRLKSEFLSNMSHELRTPLNSILALSRLMKDQPGSLQQEQREYLRVIERNGRQLLELINDILDLSKIESGRIDLRKEEISVPAVLGDITETFRPVAEEKGISLEEKIEGTLPVLYSDQSRLRQILRNLVGNAVKFTDEGGVIIRAAAEEGHLRIDVSDTGVGIPEEQIEAIFDEFRQIDGSAARRYEGTGLGLAIARKSARLLGGDIIVRSRVGEGSTFTVTMPWELEKQDLGTKEESTGLNHERHMQLSKKTKEKGVVLIVDDEEAVRSNLSQVLERRGYRTLNAASGEEAIRLAKEHHPDVITLDVVMPDVDGWEVLQRLKSSRETCEIPILVVSVSEERKRGFALGAVGYLTKPVDPERLFAEIEKLVARRPKRVLVVDDNPVDRQAFSRALAGKGFTIVEAEGGEDCLEKIPVIAPDLVVLDLMMPDVSGFEVLDRIRRNEKTKTLPVIVVTARDLSAEEKDRLRGSTLAVLQKSQTTYEKIAAAIEAYVKEATKPAILLVEDNEIAALQVKTLVEEEDLAVVDVVPNGEEALQYVEMKTPDAMILDLMMPGVDGFAVLEQIRSKPETRELPVLVITAKDLTAADRSRLGTNHVRQYVIKGDIDRDGLVARVKEILESREPVAPRCPDRPIERLPEGPDVLIIEDNPDNLLVLKALLPPGLSVDEAATGQEGLEKIRQALPGLVFLDLKLPDMHGYDLVKDLRRCEQEGHLPVVAVTAQAMKGDVERALEAGCDDYLAKPIERDQLERIIETYLSRG